MDVERDLIERVVAAVQARLCEGGEVVEIGEAVVTGELLEGRLGTVDMERIERVVQLVPVVWISAKAVVTPSGRDVLRRRGVTCLRRPENGAGGSGVE